MTMKEKITATKKSSKKKTTAVGAKTPTGPLWKKLEDYIYEKKDPSGGIYRCVAKREMNQEELFQKWQYTYVFCSQTHPKKGETHLMILRD